MSAFLWLLYTHVCTSAWRQRSTVDLQNKRAVPFLFVHAQLSKFCVDILHRTTGYRRLFAMRVKSFTFAQSETNDSSLVESLHTCCLRAKSLGIQFRTFIHNDVSVGRSVRNMPIILVSFINIRLDHHTNIRIQWQWRPIGVAHSTNVIALINKYRFV